MSFTRVPDVFLFRELIPGTKKYRYKVIDGANTLDAAIDKSVDTHNALRSEILEQAKDVAIRKAQYEIDNNSPKRRARMITENMVRSKKSVLESASITSLMKSKKSKLISANQKVKNRSRKIDELLS